jgi:hypothetical protein
LIFVFDFRQHICTHQSAENSRKKCCRSRSSFQGIYRILRYLETKNTTTLVVGILCFFCIGVIVGIIVLITEITSGRVTVLAE